MSIEIKPHQSLPIGDVLVTNLGPSSLFISLDGDGLKAWASEGRVNLTVAWWSGRDRTPSR